jgi:membrane-associated HD superfamily phosphohydrolase
MKDPIKMIDKEGSITITNEDVEHLRKYICDMTNSVAWGMVGATLLLSSLCILAVYGYCLKMPGTRSEYLMAVTILSMFIFGCMCYAKYYKIRYDIGGSNAP